MRQIRHVIGSASDFENKLNDVLSVIENHESDTIENITYSTCMKTTATGVEVEYSAFVEIETDYEEEDYDEEDEKNEEEDSFMTLMNKLKCSSRNSYSDGCR